MVEVFFGEVVVQWWVVEQMVQVGVCVVEYCNGVVMMDLEFVWEMVVMWVGVCCGLIGMGFNYLEIVLIDCIDYLVNCGDKVEMGVKVVEFIDKYIIMV